MEVCLDKDSHAIGNIHIVKGKTESSQKNLQIVENQNKNLRVPLSLFFLFFYFFIELKKKTNMHTSKMYNGWKLMFFSHS